MIIILNLFSLVFLIFKFAPHSGIARALHQMLRGYDQGGGKMVGRLIAVLLMVGIAGLLWLTVGSQRHYNKMAEKYMELPEEVQQKTITQARLIFFCSFAIMLLLMFL